MIENVPQAVVPKTCKPVMGDYDVHVWSIDITAETDHDEMQLASRVLSDHENERASRLRDKVDQQAFILRHATLRRLIGGYLGQSAQSVEISYDAHLKPQLAQHTMTKGLMFNASYSAGCAVFAFSRRGAVGIDIERKCSDIDVQDLAGRICSQDEIDRFNAIASRHRRDAFYLMWTVKEACVKALGCGLNMSLDRLDVVLPSDKRLHLPSPVDVMLDGKPWSAFSLHLGMGFSGALAVSGKNAKMPWVGSIDRAAMLPDWLEDRQSGDRGRATLPTAFEIPIASLAIRQ